MFWWQSTKGDQIGRVFAQLVIVNFGSFLKMAEVAHNFWLIICALILAKGFGTHFG
jgi:hypothetical protein